MSNCLIGGNHTAHLKLDFKTKIVTNPVMLFLAFMPLLIANLCNSVHVFYLCYLCLVFVMLSRLFVAVLWPPAFGSRL